jgi:hypothetical protein
MYPSAAFVRVLQLVRTCYTVRGPGTRRALGAPLTCSRPRIGWRSMTDEGPSTSVGTHSNKLVYAFSMMMEMVMMMIMVVVVVVVVDVVIMMMLMIMMMIMMLTITILITVLL